MTGSNSTMEASAPGVGVTKQESVLPPSYNDL
jgi:hypothetical protein